MEAKKIKLLYENFPSLSSLVITLQQRPNNKIMRAEHSSRESDYGFTQTHSYEEAVQLMQTGYDEAAKMLRDDVKQKSKIQSKYAAMVKHPTPHNAVVGFIPNVPNAIRNIPESMITKDSKPMKRKTLDIIYSMHGSCLRSTEYFKEAGATLLSAVELIEKSGIQTRIDLAFMTAEENDEVSFPTVRIKNYDERYSFQKVSFPLVHPSMFRRIGFKWLETTPQMTQDFTGGYGHPPKTCILEKNVERRKDSYLIDTAWIHEHFCSVEEILKKFEVI